MIGMRVGARIEDVRMAGGRGGGVEVQEMDFQGSGGQGWVVRACRARRKREETAEPTGWT